MWWNDLVKFWAARSAFDLRSRDMNFIADWPIFVTPNNALDFSFFLALNLTLMKTRNQLTLLQENIRAILLQGSNELRLSFSATKANVILKFIWGSLFYHHVKISWKLCRHPSNFILRKISHMTVFFIECWGDRMKQDKRISIVYILLSKSDFYKECWKRELYIFEIMMMKMTVVTIYQK